MQEALWDLIKLIFAWPGPLKDWNDWGNAAQVGGVLLNFFVLCALLFQVRQGQKATAAAEKSVKAARHAVLETSRARIDERAPRVIALLEKTSWPPTIEVVNDGEHRVHPSYSGGLMLPANEDWYLAVDVKGVLVNEGNSTARVVLQEIDPDGYAYFMLGKSDLLGDKTIPSPAKINSLNDKECFLRPGDMALFLFGGVRKLSEWAIAHEKADYPSAGSCRLTIGVRDTFGGTIDHIFVEQQGRPIEPVPGVSGHWRIAGEDSVGTTVYPVHRTYIAEGWKTPPLPWAKADEAWSEHLQKKSSLSQS
jgi:hypothetical protein